MTFARSRRLIDAIGAGVLPLLLCAASVAAETRDVHRAGDYSLTHWEQYDGLDLGFILAIAQDHNGYLWLGTSKGVVRFDGGRFRSAQDLGLPLAAGEVNALTITRGGTMWVGYVQPFGAERNFISRVQDGVVTSYGTSDGIEGPLVNILETTDGTLWVSGFKALFRFRSNRFEQVRLSLPDTTIGGLFEDRQRNVWIGSAAGVFRLRPGTQTFEQVGSELVSGFAEDRDGHIWVTSRNRGFARLSEATDSTPNDRPRGMGWKLLIDRRNEMWVATRGQALWRVTFGERHEKPRLKVFGPTDGFAATMVRSLFEDRENNVWVGTTSGLYKLSAQNVASTVTSNPVSAMAVLPDGSVWLGTTDGLLTRVSRGTQTSTIATDSFEPISAIHVDRRGTTWVSSDNAVFHLSNGRLARLATKAAASFLQIESLASDEKGNLLIADHDRGVSQWDGKVLSAVETGRPLAHPSSVAVGASGRLLVGFDGADLAVRETDGRWQYYSSGERLSSGRTVIYEDAEGVVWFGGVNGLSRLRNGQFRTVAVASGFPRTFVSGILDDDAGYLWCATPAGILRVRKSELDHAFTDPAYQLTYRTFTTADGTAGVPWSWTGGPAAVKRENGELWFATSRGVTSITPGNVTDQTAPLVRIDSIVVDDRVLPAATASVPSLAPRTSRVQIDFSSPTLTSLTRIRYRYRLEGFDADWHNADATRRAVYTNLPPGDYRFRAAASRNGTEWSEGEASWEFTIQPAYYQAPWFYGLLVTLLGLGVAIAWRLRIRRIRHRLAIVAGERLRIGREIHDHLLQDLFGVRLQLDDLANQIASSGGMAGQSSLLQKLATIRSQVGESLRETRNAVWDLRPSHREDLPTVLREIGARATQGSEIAFDLAVTGRPYQLHPSVHEQLLQIAREAVNNAVRHAHPHRISMSLQYGHRQVSLRIVDDGVGFDQGRSVDSSEERFGLAIMRERTETIGGRFEIATSLGRGTDVRLTVPVSEERVA